MKPARCYQFPNGETLLSVSFKHLAETFKDIRQYKVFPALYVRLPDLQRRPS